MTDMNPNPTPEIPAPSDSRNDRLWAALAHAAGFALFLLPLGQILIPLIIWVVKKDKSRFIATEAKEALNFQISITIYALVAASLVIILIGVPLLVALVIFDIVMILRAIIKAGNGEAFRYPLTIRFVQ